MTLVLLAGLGITFTTLFVGLPLLHVLAWTSHALTSGQLALALLPLAALVGALVRPGPGTTLFAFPVAHIPILLALPDLTGRLVYTGASGLLAFGAVVLVGAAWCAVATRAASPSPHPRARVLPRRDAVLVGLTAVAGFAVLGAFLAPVFAIGSAAPAPAAGQVAVLTGAAVAAWVAGRMIVGDLADLWYDPRARGRQLARATRPRAPSAAVLWSVLAAALTLALLATLIYGVTPPR